MIVGEVAYWTNWLRISMAANLDFSGGMLQIYQYLANINFHSITADPALVQNKKIRSWAGPT